MGDLTLRQFIRTPMGTSYRSRNSERGSSILEYLCPLFFVAIFGVIGLESLGRTVGEEFDQVRIRMNSLGGGSMTTTGGIDSGPCESGGQ
jgi:hypothetical protein